MAKLKALLPRRLGAAGLLVWFAVAAPAPSPSAAAAPAPSPNAAAVPAAAGVVAAVLDATGFPVSGLRPRRRWMLRSLSSRDCRL